MYLSLPIPACAVAASILMGWHGTSADAAGSGTCAEPNTGTLQAPIFSPPLAEIIVGKGRMQFYAAPNIKCATKGVFVVPRDTLVAYA